MESNPEMAALRDTQWGRCFLVGCGPSLNVTPLDRLREPSFACNGIHEIFPKVVWRPTYYGLMWTPNRAKRRKYFQPALDKSATVFLDERWKGKLDCPRAIYFSIGYDWDGAIHKHYWSWDVSKLVGCHHTSVYQLAQIAVYIGFTELVLVGCDSNYVQGWNNFSPDYYPGTYLEEAQVAEIHRMHRHAWEQMRAACSTRGIKILDATIGGKLDVFPKVDIEEVLSARR